MSDDDIVEKIRKNMNVYPGFWMSVVAAYVRRQKLKLLVTEGKAL